jgi:uncharacterized protein
VSKTSLIFEIKGKFKLSCDLKRHLSPRTVGFILRALPLQGNAHHLGQSIVYLETSIDSGIERPRREFKKGDIAFLPVSGSICFFTKDTEPGKTMTPIGKILGELNVLDKIKPGDVILLYAETG